MPRYSFIIPAYNADATLGRTLDSLLAQTQDNWECVVVDDGSTDSTGRVLEDYCKKDSRIRGVQQENAGTAAALNTAAYASTGEFLVQLGADDELLPGFCRDTDRLIVQKPDFDIYAANAWQFFPNGDKEYFNKGARFEEQTSITFEDQVSKSLIYCTAAVRRELFLNLEGFRAHIYNEDYDFWLRALAAGARHIYQPKMLSLYHSAPNQKTADALKVRESDWDILDDLATGELLSEDQVLRVRARQNELQDNIALRKKLYRIMGVRMTEALISRIRSLRGKN
ncbi:MAG: glycosyltransferase family 2 protein [Coriobacteriia bacterium]|nr:glycosyltransferase family 2 protein [Coriobacteriia bacterium]MCL2747016.1 glycosyltransferase family 2 protein [Coriobacteriia bacterium]